MSILTITLNPALDLTTEAEKVEAGYKLRCGPVRYDPGGGGVNVSRAIAKLGGESLPFVAIGGVTGDMLKALLKDEHIEAAWFGVDGLTRESFVVNERSTGKQFRFVLPGPEWSGSALEDMLQALEDTLSVAPDPIGYVVASGSLPQGVPDECYHKIATIVERSGARFVLDTSGRALATLACGGQHPPNLWIMDHGEAEHIAGRGLPDMNALERFAVELKGRNLAEIVVLTFREGGTVAISDAENLRIMPPKVDVLSKVGAGDSFVAGLVYKLSLGSSLRDSCAYAVAAAASAVTTPATELCDREQTERYFRMIRRKNA